MMHGRQRWFRARAIFFWTCFGGCRNFDHHPTWRYA